MNILRFKNIFYVFITLLLLGITITSCERDKLNSKNSELNTNQAFDTNTMDKLYNHLITQTDLIQMDMSDRLMVLKEFANSENIEFDLNRTIESYENGVSKTDLSTGDIFVQNQYDIVLVMIAEYGLTNKLKLALMDYREELITEAANSNIDIKYYNIALDWSWIVEYMADSKAYQDYLNQILFGSDLLNTNLSIQSRGFLSCYFAQVALGLVQIACSAGIDIACGQIPELQARVESECNDGPPLGPCENSPNPCCGVNCIPGYMCVSGDCVIDPNNPPECLNDSDCPEFHSCAGHECIPW